MLSDEHIAEWISALRAGDETAFREVFDHYSARVYRYILRFVPDEPVAQELTQDVFMKVWDYRRELDASQSFHNFLFKVAKNHILNYLRDHQHDARRAREYRLTLPAYHTAVEDGLLHEEYLVYANRAIAMLPDKRRKIFVMSRVEGKSYDQISQDLGISKDTVRLQLIKSLKFIREYLNVHLDISVILVTFSFLL